MLSRLFFGVCLLLTLELHAQQVRIAFGSCSDEDDSVQLWSEIRATQPDAWVWLGDNIYGDTPDPLVLRQKYAKQKSHPEYQALIKQTKVFGTWDDHDYGLNDGGKTFAIRDESKEELLHFLGYPEDHEVNGHRGVYHRVVVGTPPHAVRILLLDTRYFRDSLQRSTNPARRYDPTDEGDLLGDEQWAWLEHELADNEYEVTIIASSIQFISQEQGFEKWYNLIRSHSRMLALLGKYRPKRTFFISGDRHFAEISRRPVRKLPYPLFDFTSSGLTEVYKLKTLEPNAFRVAGPITERNFGVIDVDWRSGKPVVSYHLYGLKGAQYLSLVDIYQGK